MCGQGTFYLYKYLYWKKYGKLVERMDNNDVYACLKKEEDADLKGRFTTCYFDFLCRCLNNVVKQLLPEGGKLYVGGFVSQLATKLFQSQEDFMEFWRGSLKRADWSRVAGSVDICMFGNDIHEFAIRGAINLLRIIARR